MVYLVSRFLSPYQWKETSTLRSGNADNAGFLRDTLSILHFSVNIEFIFFNKVLRRLHPASESMGI